LPEKKEPPYLILFLLLSLLLHLGLVYRYRAWQPSAKTLEELRRKQRDEIPVQIVELPPKEKKKEAPKPPPKKPTLLADRNEQSKTNTRTDASAPQTVRVKPKPKPQPARPKPAPPKPDTKARPKVQAKQVKSENQPPKDDSAIAKPRPKRQAPKKSSSQTKKESPQETMKKPVKEPLKETRPDVKKLFPSFKELTKITEELRQRPAPPGKQQPHLPNKLKRGTEISLNTLDYKFHSYYLSLKRKIELVWEYPYKARQTGAQGRLLMRFVINQDGSLAEVTVLRSSGVALLDREAVRAIKSASPFPPLPDRMNTERLSVTATFEYLLSYRSVH